MRPTAMIMTLAAIFLAACVNPAESLPAEADVTFDGAGNGDQSEKASCDSEATLSGNGEVTDGQVTITVTDDQGETLHSDTYAGDFKTGSIALNGHSGTWTIEADRTQDDVIGDEFRGEYAFFLNCAGI